MNLSTELAGLLNDQLKAEREAQASYWLAQLNAEAVGLTGFAAWFGKAAGEELQHGQKIAAYMVDRNAVPAMVALDARPPLDWDAGLAGGVLPNTVRDTLTGVLALEQSVTESLRSIYAFAATEGDEPTCIFLQWFLAEQVESEHAVETILGLLRLAGDNAAALLDIDDRVKEL